MGLVPKLKKRRKKSTKYQLANNNLFTVTEPKNNIKECLAFYTAINAKHLFTKI